MLKHAFTFQGETLGSLTKELPYWSVWRQAVSTTDGYLIRGVRLKGLDINCRTDSEIEAATKRLGRWLDGLEEGLSLQVFCEFGDFVEEEGFYREFLHPLDNATPIAKYLGRSKVKHLKHESRLIMLRTYFF